MLQPPNYQADASTYLSNRQALRALEQEDKLLSTVYYGCSSLLAAGTVFFSPSGILALPPMWLLLRRTHKLNQIHRSMTALLDTFEDQGVEIIPHLEIPGQGSLDLFARFPSKHLFAIALRSQGKSTIFYNEAEEALYIRRQQGGRGLNLWTPDHVQRLSDQEFWLRRNQSDLFGKSSRDKRRPLVKLLVLTGQTRLGKHSEHLYAMMGNQKVLLLRKRASVYVLEEEQLTDFVKAWLAQQPQ